MTKQLVLIWEHVRAPIIVPLLKLEVVNYLAMSVMLFVKRGVHGCGDSVGENVWQEA